MRYFERGGEVPLLAKAERKSTRPPPRAARPGRGAGHEGGKIAGIGVHAGLWTSQALTLPAEEVPVLRRRLDQLDKDFGFDPKGHSGKALRHAVGSLPRDLLINLSQDSVRELVMTAMSLADRPRPALLQVRSILKGHLFTFVWLPREELTTSRRKAIAMMLEMEVGSEVIELVGRAWRRRPRADPLHPIYRGRTRALPDADALDAALVEMVRGWAPAVEAELIAAVGPARATRLSLTYLNAFPDGYRARTSPEEGAADILRLSGARPTIATAACASGAPRSSRPAICTSRPIARTALIPLSEAVPVLENFGFRVLEEMPTALGGGALGYIHDFRLEIGSGGRSRCDHGPGRRDRATPSPACSAARRKTTSSTS